MKPLIVRVSEAGLCLLFLIAPLLSRSPAWNREGLLLLGLTLVCWAGLCKGISRRERKGRGEEANRGSGKGGEDRPDRLERALIAGLFAWLAASALAAPDPWQGVRSVGALAACLLCFALARGGVSPGLGRRLAGASVLCGGWAAAVGIAEYYGVWTPARPYPGRVVGAFANPNDLGIFLCLLLPAGILLLLSGMGPVRKGGVMAGVVLAYTCLLMSGSRGAWWAGLCAGGALILGGWRAGLSEALRRSRGWALALLLVLAGITVLYSVPSPLKAPTAVSIPDRFASSGEIAQGIARPGGAVSGTSVGHRYLIWSAAGAMVAGHPLLGVGPGRFEGAYPAFRDRLLQDTRFDRLEEGMRNEDVPHAHNDYLQMGAEAGTPGLLLFGVVVGGWVAGAWRRTRGAGDVEERLLRLGFLAGSVAVLVNALVSYPLHIPAVAGLFWSFLGMAGGRGGSRTAPPIPLPCR